MTSALRAPRPSSELPPWDLGRVQPELFAALEQLAPRGRSLDVGCGTGEAVLALADMGVDAWGIYADADVVAQARLRAVERGLRATIVHGDPRTFASLGKRFDVVTDSGLFHALEGGERTALVASSWQAVRPGGHYVVLGVEPGQCDQVPGTTEDDLFDAFSPGWTEVLVRPARYLWSAQRVPAAGWLGVFRRD